ncbi:MAG: DUF3696 domain-containing protein [Vulcanimicrobiota bacterium]
MDQITIRGVRCFYEQQSVPLKPLTLLVGENSSGKSTFLALARIIWDIMRLEFSTIMSVNFNEEPFRLGAYAQIASFRGGKAGRVKDFVIGCKSRLESKKITKPHIREIELTCRFIENDAQPRLCELTLSTSPYELTFKINTQGESLTVFLSAPSGKYVIDSYMPRSIRFLFRAMMDEWRPVESTKQTRKKPTEEDLEIIDLLTSTFAKKSKKPYAFAPIRTSPQRTYDPITDVPHPEGSHVPIMLAKMIKTDPAGGKLILDTLSRFGEESGLFKDVEVRKLGNKESDPFQINVKISGPSFNLVDVGYGVSQILPIVFDSLRGPAGSVFLLQQPEVHLHPRAQAALGSFLATLVVTQKKHFLIETHSDYILDRIRMDVRDGKSIKADDVSILFFKRENGGVKIFPLEIDKFGNILHAPEGYRQFFLDEEYHLLEG